MHSQEARDLLAYDSNWNHKPGEPIQEALAMGIDAIKNTTWTPADEEPEEEDMYIVAWKPSYGTLNGIPHYYGFCQWNNNSDEKGWGILGMISKMVSNYRVEDIQILAYMPKPDFFE